MYVMGVDVVALVNVKIVKNALPVQGTKFLTLKVRICQLAIINLF